MNLLLRNFRFAALCSAFAIALPCVSHADLIVRVENATINAGGAGTIDVMISSDSGTDQLWAYGFEFQISTLTGSSVLKFQDPQTSPETADPNFVFATDGSAGVGGGVSLLGDNYTAANISNNAGGTTVVTNPVESLLARLQIFSVAGSNPVAGDQFTISLIPSFNTFFLDPAATNLIFSSTSGVVTLAPAAVPEPSSLLFASALALGLRTFARRKKLAASPTKA